MAMGASFPDDGIVAPGLDGGPTTVGRIEGVGSEAGATHMTDIARRTIILVLRSSHGTLTIVSDSTSRCDHWVGWFGHNGRLTGFP